MPHRSPRDPALAPRHAPLRQDVGYLGDLLGEVLRDQGGEALLGAVETVRACAIRRREDGGSLEPLAEHLQDLEIGEASALVRAFSVYFSLTNLAEQAHRIRRRRDYQLEGKPQPGSLEAVFESLAGVDPDRLTHALGRLRVMPVFTAHPTEATRRTILRKEQRIARALVDRIEQPRRTPMEDRRITERIRSEVGLIWQTAGQSSLAPTVAGEVEHVLFFLTDVVYRIVPAFVEALEAVAPGHRGEVGDPALPHSIVRFGSWVGGDMDGNPNVGAPTILATLARHRELILRKYRAEVRGLFEHLSQSESRVEVSRTVLSRKRDYETRFPETAGTIPPRYVDMPYRMLLWLIWHRLGETASGHADGYRDAAEFLGDLTIVEQSLAEHRGSHAGRSLVRRLMLRVSTFGFHLATLDLRQDARVHREVLGHLLDDPEFPDRSAEARTAAIETAIRRKGSPGRVTGHPAATEALAVFRAAGEAMAMHGTVAIGPFIISMAQGPDDVLAVLALARTAGLIDPGDRVPLDVAPLFETVDDLENAHRTLAAMLAHPLYRDHLRARGDHQVVMLGYSDSAKISGVGASRWALYRAQERLVALAAEHGIDLELFHGRGGTIARGGSKPRAAILAGPPGSTPGRLRTTEQGEIINGKFGLRGIAERTLELTTGAVLEATVRDTERAAPPESWRAAMEALATASRRSWNAMVHEDPRFIPYFRAATPVDVIERMAMGSRPASRRSGGGVENLRAIPWVFAWSQSRHTLPAWYGLGAGLEAAETAHGLDVLREMAGEWPFFQTLLDDASMALAKADLDIASAYATLADAEARSIYTEIAGAFHDTRERVLRIRGERELLDHEPLLREIIRLRNPYVDPMSLIQVDLLRRWRDSGREDTALERALFDTVRGIARGLRNTG